MAVDRTLQIIIEQQRALETQLDRLEGLSPTSGGPGGHGGGRDQMDRRIERLETQWDGLQSDISEIKASLATLMERTAYMPKRFEFYTIIFASITAIGGLVMIASRMSWI